MKQTETYKYCKLCDTWKLKTAFNKHATRYDGLQSCCSVCQPERTRATRRRRKVRELLGELRQHRYAETFNVFHVIPPIPDKLAVPMRHKPGKRVRVNADRAW